MPGFRLTFRGAWGDIVRLSCLTQERSIYVAREGIRKSGPHFSMFSISPGCSLSCIFNLACLRILNNTATSDRFSDQSGPFQRSQPQLVRIE